MGCQTNKHHCSGPTFWVILGVQEESIVGNKSWHEAYTNLEMAWKTVENGEVFAFFLSKSNCAIDFHCQVSLLCKILLASKHVVWGV